MTIKCRFASIGCVRYVPKTELHIFPKFSNVPFPATKAAATGDSQTAAFACQGVGQHTFQADSYWVPNCDFIASTRRCA